MNYLSNNVSNHKPISPVFHRVIATHASPVVHLGWRCPACEAATGEAIARHTGTFRSVNCPKCLESFPEAAWPTPQRETTEEGKWVILDFGFCFVAVCKLADGSGWRGLINCGEDNGIPNRFIGGKGWRSFRHHFLQIVRYVNNGNTWKANNTYFTKEQPE